jgi:hypothetical protein
MMLNTTIDLFTMDLISKVMACPSPCASGGLSAGEPAASMGG